MHVVATQNRNAQACLDKASACLQVEEGTWQHHKWSCLNTAGNRSRRNKMSEMPSHIPGIPYTARHKVKIHRQKTQ